METQHGQIKGQRQAAWIFQRARLALAVEIVKNRPPGKSSREHAEALGCELRRQDRSWEKKAQELQQEVLRLRQEACITRVTSNTKRTVEAAGQDSVDVSPDLFGSGSVPSTSHVHLVSDSETPELLPRDAQPALTSPQRLLPSGHQWGSMLPHARFLQSVCALQRAEGSGSGLEPLWFCSDDDAGSVLVDSVCQLLDSVLAACRDPPPLGAADLVPQGCQVAARAMDLFCSQRRPSVEFMRRVEDTLRELTGMLQHRSQLSGLEDAEKLTGYLIALGSSSMSKSFLIRHILSEISALADQLWQAFQGQESSRLEEFPLDEYQNSCYLFLILEELLQKSKVPYQVEVGSDQSGFLKHLEQHVFLLSDEFPLFSIYMWRIGGLLTTSDR